MARLACLLCDAFGYVTVLYHVVVPFGAIVVVIGCVAKNMHLPLIDDKSIKLHVLVDAYRQPCFTPLRSNQLVFVAAALFEWYMLSAICR